MPIKQMIRAGVRKILFVRPKESVSDAITRHKLHIKRKIDCRRLELPEFNLMLSDMGIQIGDVLIVHAAWRGCYALQATPNEVIASLKQCVGEEGTLLMPCYGADPIHFDVCHTPSAAGVLSELLRNDPKAMRSGFPNAAMCGVGPEAEEILSTHIKSKYAFDEQSPYYKAIINHRAKVLLIGLPLRTAKISAFHCGAYDAWFHSDTRDRHYRQGVRIASVIDAHGEAHQIMPYDRIAPGPCKKNYRKLFRSVPKTTQKRAGVRLIAFRGSDAYEAAKAFCQNGGTLYH